MKKLSKLALAAFCVLSLIFAASCSNISGNVEGESPVGIKAFVNGAKNLVDFNSSRSIVPDAFKLDSTNPELDFYLAYQKTTDTTKWTIETNKVTITPDTGSTSSGTFLITIPQANYNLRLYGVPEGTTVDSSTAIDNLNSSAALVGETTADLRRGDVVTFTLTADTRILTGHSSAALVMYAIGDWNTASNFTDNTAYSVSAELQNVLTGETVTGTQNNSITLATETTATAITDVSTITETTATYSNTQTVPAGTYNIVVKFTKGTAVYEYSDTVIIVPGKTTKGVIAIPKVVATEPDAPAGFQAGFIAPTSVEDGYYKVEFVWEDKSNNEAYFELQLADVTDSTAAVTLPTGPATSADTTDTSWVTVVENQTNVKVTRYGVVNSNIKNSGFFSTPQCTYTNNDGITEFYGTNNDLYLSGSLNKNNEVAMMKLPLGNRYVARIRAVNAAGPSSWAYVKIDTDIAADTAKNIVAAEAFDHTQSEADTTNTPAVSNCINLYRLTYSLGANTTFSDAGTGTVPVVIPAAGSTTFPIADNQIVSYYNASTAGIAILNPNGYKTSATASTETDGDSDSKPDALQLKQGNSYYWTHWNSGIGHDGTPASLTANKNYADDNETPTAYTGFKNLTLTAVYGSEGGVSVVDPSKFNIKRANIKATYDGNDTTFSDTTPSISVDTAKSTVLWTVTYPTGVTYERVEIEVRSTKSGSTPVATSTITADGGTWEESISGLSEGTYEVRFKAYHSSNESYYSTTITMTVSEG